MTTNTFYETQRFDQNWIHLLMCLVLFVTLIPVYLVFKEGLTSYDLLASSSGFIIVLLIWALLFLLKLHTRIDENGIHYRFFPFIGQKTIVWQDMANCYVRTYSPLSEYGGWGIRFGRKGKAYNVKGNKGIQVVLKSGKKILFGTQNETEAERVIETYFKK